MERTFNKYVDFFLYTVKKIEVEKTTFVGYENICKHIKNFFGTKDISKVKKSDVQLYFKYLAEREYCPGKYVSTNTIRKHYDFLNQIFLAAIADEIIIENPMEKIKKLPKKDFFCEVYNEEEAFHLLNICKDTDLFLPVLFAIFLGLRRGEICGLKWKYVNLEEKYILLKYSRTTAGTEIVSKTVKTKQSVRKMYLSNFLTEILRKEKELQQSYFKCNLNDYYICIRRHNYKPIHPDYISNAFPKLLKKNNIKKIRFHDLRHSCASIANNNGETLFNISKMLGHSSTSITTKLYIHLFDTTHEKTICCIENSILQKKIE